VPASYARNIRARSVRANGFLKRKHLLIGANGARWSSSFAPVPLLQFACCQAAEIPVQAPGLSDGEELDKRGSDCVAPGKRSRRCDEGWQSSPTAHSSAPGRSTNIVAAEHVRI
jgi:hypothetical protein